MLIRINSPDQLGLVARAVRKAGDIRLDDLAATAAVSKQFVTDMEHGKPTIRLGLAMKLLEELGVVLRVDLPDQAAAQYEALRATGLRPLKKTARKAGQ